MKHVVKQLWLSGKGKKMFKSGDVVTAADFPNNFEQLIKEGRIVCVDETQTTEPSKASEPEDLDETKESEGTGTENEGTELKEGEDGQLDETQTTEPSKASEPLFYFDPTGENKPICNENDLNKKELIQELSKRGIVFNPADKKEPLWDLLVSNL